ncbi:Ldh family oxidoreductase [Bosea sp. (in: a-proteobacteria)]|jgi:(2R)-3-sulfolactate dehydrogenase (NADP+)|uniref:Ldh family oxidoreductase n=1 Tax=Bosea sp. (in: a-proteobacteria) TaxID=1871050 RepID=UPI003F70B858
MSLIVLSLDEVERIAFDALMAAGAASDAARPLACAVMAAERDGVASHGLAYVPTYCEHLVCGKVDRAAVPIAETRGSVVSVDAASGFAHPAIALGFTRLVPLAKELGAAILVVRNSYNCGVLGHHTDALARAGLVGLGFTNAPASIAPVGGTRPVVGTNPWSVAVPDGRGGVGLLIDQSASVIAKSEVMRHARTNQPIPLGWALDSAGRPTTDAGEALKGTMAPSGGYKGFGSGLLVELFAACLTGATLGISASPFSGTAGGPPRTGQFFLAVYPEATSQGAFADSVAALVGALAAQEGARVPGSRRITCAREAERNGISIDSVLHQRLLALAG